MAVFSARFQMSKCLCSSLNRERHFRFAAIAASLLGPIERLIGGVDQMRIVRMAIECGDADGKRHGVHRAIGQIECLLLDQLTQLFANTKGPVFVGFDERDQKLFPAIAEDKISRTAMGQNRFCDLLQYGVATAMPMGTSDPCSRVYSDEPTCTAGGSGKSALG